MAEHHGGIWEKVSRFTCHLPVYRCCSACEVPHLSLVEARGMIDQGTNLWEEDQKIKRIITDRRRWDERAIDLTAQRLKPLPSPEEAIIRQATSKAVFKPEKEDCDELRQKLEEWRRLKYLSDRFMPSPERILSDDLIRYITSDPAVAQVFRQLETPEGFEHASFKGGIALDDTWDALPELFKVRVTAVGEKRSRRAVERVRDENVQSGVVSVEDGGGLLKEKEARARKRVREGFENENIEVGTPRRRRAAAHAGSSQGSGRGAETPIR
ncbi:hypothetical protein J008_04677 [Cryptococcus neoformans]|nr:hypothetical protein J008_04677 [Cryptococcus neoformans var. grubii]